MLSKNISMCSKEYRNLYLFYYFLYVVFSCVIFSIHETVVFVEVVGIFAIGFIFAFINTELFFRLEAKFKFKIYNWYNPIALLFLIIFLYVQYFVNEGLLRF